MADNSKLINPSSYLADARTIDAKLSIVVPRRGINDEGKGKKHALYRLISEAQTEYVWLQDDDIIPPSSEIQYPLTEDLYILPLRMESESEQPSLLEQLQIAEYAAIQQLTIEAAQRFSSSRLRLLNEDTPLCVVGRI